MTIRMTDAIVCTFKPRRRRRSFRNACLTGRPMSTAAFRDCELTSAVAAGSGGFGMGGSTSSGSPDTLAFIWLTATHAVQLRQILASGTWSRSELLIEDGEQRVADRAVATPLAEVDHGHERGLLLGQVPHLCLEAVDLAVVTP